MSRKYAPTELDRARKLLVNAEGSAKEDGANSKVATHYAYLATQVARIAEQRSQEQVAMARVKAGETERQKILLSARESEANRALAQARDAQAQAEQARNEALNAQSQAAQTQADNQRLHGRAAGGADLSRHRAHAGRCVVRHRPVAAQGGRHAARSSRLPRSSARIPERSVQVEGFTDSQGSNEYNQQLSQRRADAVAQAIIQRGIDAQRVRALGYGEEFPKASNENAGSRQLNRRVEIVVSNGDAAIPARSGPATSSTLSDQPWRRWRSPDLRWTTASCA